VHTPKTRGDIEARIVPAARSEGVDLDAGRYDLFELADGEDFGSCLDRLRELTREVTEWVARDPAFQVVVDFTGGTKSMSASISLQASRWPCLFSYVGGTERTKEGVGIVVAGSERVVHQANPWDALGHQAVDDFVVLFDQHAFAAAAKIVRETKKRVSRPDRKRELAVLEYLAQAFDAWDRFDHRTSGSLFDSVAKSANDLRAVMGAGRGNRVLDGVARLASHLRELCGAPPPSRHHVLDLLANGRRRREEGRIDDAVARLYRAIEAVAQVALRTRHGIENTERVPVDRVPDPMRSEWASRAREGVIALGLQDAYRLLGTLNDSLGEKFRQEGLAGLTSPLTARNRSILAHGFERVPDAAYEKLWRAVLSLAEVEQTDLPSFIALGERVAP
jgi:CRISPR-associated protein (TIGR02710 family)